MLKQPIITIVGGTGAMSSIAWVDYDIANGVMDVRWRITGITARYNVAYLTFRAAMQSPSPSKELHAMKASLRVSSVPSGTALRVSGRRQIEMAAADLPEDGQELIAAPFKQALTKLAEGGEFVFG